MCVNKVIASLFVVGAVLLVVVFGALTPTYAILLRSEGGPIFGPSWPCVFPPGFIWNVKLNTLNNTTLKVVSAPFYPIQKLHFLPPVPGTTTLGQYFPYGVCIVFVPCPVGLCPYYLPTDGTHVQYGIAPVF